MSKSIAQEFAAAMGIKGVGEREDLGAMIRKIEDDERTRASLRSAMSKTWQWQRVSRDPMKAMG